MPPDASPRPVPPPADERIGHGPALLAAFAWTLLIGAAAGVNYENHQWDAFQHARSVANAYVDKDLAVRRWISEHGGVYVPPSEATPPNPWLNVPDRDVVTTGGQALTLVNPAYATRQLQEDFALLHGIKSHLTGLVLKNPNNAPTPWERRALEQLAAGARDVVEEDRESGQAVLRLMRPVFMEQGCMKCHADMNIPVGGLRGGISTTLPMEPYLAEHHKGLMRAIFSHVGIWCVGLLGIAWNARRFRERALERVRALLTAQRDDRRIVEILSMSERLDKMTEREIIQEGLEAAVRLTDSKIGFFHFVNEDQNSIELVTWSKDTLASYCHAAYDTHYPIERAGVWADCARLHQPVIHNDYPGLAVKRGLPEGHAPLQRLMSVPVIESGAVRVITGVGNKERLYDDADLRLVQLLANDVWKLVQRKRADTGLRESEHRLREAQRVANLGSWRVDHGSGAHVWSDQMYALFGVDPATFTPTAESIVALGHPDDREQLASALRRTAVETRPADMRVRIVRPDGAVRLIHLRAVAICAPDGQPTSSVGTAHDITDETEMERLKQTKAELTVLFEHTDRMIWLIDTESRLVVGNPVFHQSMESAFGHPVHAGDPLPDPTLPPDRAARWRELYRRALAGEQFSDEIEFDADAGGPRWTSVSFFPILDELTGRVSGVNVSARDCTDRRRLEEAQHRTMARMEQVVSQLEAHHQRSLRVQQLNDLLQSCRAETEAYEVVQLLAPDILGGGAGSLALAAPGERDLQTVARWGHPTSRSTPLFGVDDCWALRRGEFHIARRLGDLQCRHFEGAPEHGYFCLALVVRGETLGLLTVEYASDLSPAAMADLHDAAKTVAGTVKLGLSNLRLRLALEEQAVHDALTGLFNRRYLDMTLPRELHRAERAGGRVTLAMLDIDHFKRFNDTLGHEAGDLVLRSLGALLLRRLRRSDTGCRYGGEEILLILPDVDATSACERLRGVCDEIRQMNLTYRGASLPPVTVSIGIASTDAHGYDAHGLARSADEALYAAKQAGRDRIVICEAPT